MLSKVLYIVTLDRKYARALTFESLWKAAAVLLRDLECFLLLECVLVQAAAVLLRDLALSCRLAGSSCIEGLLLPYSRSLLTLDLLSKATDDVAEGKRLIGTGV